MTQHFLTPKHTVLPLLLITLTANRLCAAAERAIVAYSATRDTRFIRSLPLVNAPLRPEEESSPSSSGTGETTDLPARDDLRIISQTWNNIEAKDSLAIRNSTLRLIERCIKYHQLADGADRLAAAQELACILKEDFPRMYLRLAYDLEKTAHSIGVLLKIWPTDSLRSTRGEYLKYARVYRAMNLNYLIKTCQSLALPYVKIYAKGIQDTLGTSINDQAIYEYLLKESKNSTNSLAYSTRAVFGFACLDYYMIKKLKSKKLYEKAKEWYFSNGAPAEKPSLRVIGAGLHLINRIQQILQLNHHGKIGEQVRDILDLALFSKTNSISVSSPKHIYNPR